MTEAITQLFREGLELNRFTLRTSSEFGASNPSYRLMIRTAIAQHCKDENITARTIVADLSARPILDGHTVSISHTRDVGGFALADAQIGFDIERIESIYEKVVERVCSPEELSACPNKKLLWSAKEAAFKSLPPAEQPKVMSAVHVHTWGDFSEKLLNFRASLGEDVSNSFGSGLIFDSGTHYFSLFRSSLSTLV